MTRYYKRNWEETRGDEFDSWGTSIWYFEVGNDNYLPALLSVSLDQLKSENKKKS